MKELLRGAMEHVKRRGAEYADARHVRGSNEILVMRNGELETASVSESEGFGIRVLLNGAWGFSSSSTMTPEKVTETAERALAIAKASGSVGASKVVLDGRPPAKDTYANKVLEDPFAVPLPEKVGMLADCCERMSKVEGIRFATASMQSWRTEKLFVATDGSEIAQTITEAGGGISATAMDGDERQTRSYPASFRGDYSTAGFEFTRSLRLADHADRVAREAVELLKADECPTKKTALIIGGSQLALQVHESCGHPIELDRVFGTEASYAGTSFLTTEKRGSFRYGSKLVNIVQDATAEGGLGSFGYDDEGVRAQRTDVVREGVFAGYLMSRETAPLIGLASNGAMRAEGWDRIPLVRMTNVNLLPGAGTLADLIADTKDGIFIDFNKSWSIDQRRLNFQFGCEIAWEIRSGRLGRMLKNPVYTGITPEFWGSCDAIAGPEEWHIWGIPSCGKGEPGQSAHVGHGVAPTRFQNVQVGVQK
ncbi:MAG: TldD/PmbA family protein [Candidatus Eisenbacteria bacterium]|nr:TldD/PmbA family protein [Candidatus Eisenbacteria bacterium]